MTELGVTQEQLAEQLQMTQGGLGHWLNGKRQPPFDRVGEIADFLQIDRAEIGAALLGVSHVTLQLEERPTVDYARAKPRSNAPSVEELHRLGDEFAAVEMNELMGLVGRMETLERQNAEILASNKQIRADFEKLITLIQESRRIPAPVERKAGKK